MRKPPGIGLLRFYGLGGCTAILSQRSHGQGYATQAYAIPQRDEAASWQLSFRKNWTWVGKRDAINVPNPKVADVARPIANASRFGRSSFMG
jgi:hypothetical protein